MLRPNHVHGALSRLSSLGPASLPQLTENSTEPWTNGLMKLSSVSRHLREIANSYLQYPLDWVLTRGQNAQLRSDDGSTSPVSFLHLFE